MTKQRSSPRWPIESSAAVGNTYFAASFLSPMRAKRLAKHFDRTIGRPTKELDESKQRLDSTHTESHMAKFGRIKLTATATRRPPQTGTGRT